MRRTSRDLVMSKAKSIENIASSMFVIGPTTPSDATSKLRSETSSSRRASMDQKSADAASTEKKRKLTSEEKDMLGGIEYQSLKLLFKIILCMFFS